MSESIPLARVRSPAAARSDYARVDPEDTEQEAELHHVSSYDSMEDDARLSAIHPPWKRNLYMLVERPTSSFSAFVVHVLTTSLIVISAVVTVLETIPSFHSIPPQIWFGLETALVVLFTVEYVARCVAHSADLWTFFRWFGSFFALIDLLGILPYYIEIALHQDTATFFRFTILRTFRLLRVFRPFRHNNTILLTIEVMYLSFRRSQHALLALSFFVVMVLVVFSTLLYFAERGTWDEVLGTFINSDGDPSQFAVPITTVGYGEITPRSFLGRLITLPLLVFGLLLIALPTFVLGREFSMIWEMMKEDQVSHEDVFNAHGIDPLASPTLARQRSISVHSIRADPSAVTADLWRHPRDEPGTLHTSTGHDFQETQALRAQIAELKTTVDMQGAMLRRILDALEARGKRDTFLFILPGYLQAIEMSSTPPPGTQSLAVNMSTNMQRGLQRGRGQHKTYAPGKRRMELMPSVSRSSGLDKDGDALRDHKVQEEYRVFIEGKVCKLREGLLSSKRSDAFALEVYETSLCLSVIFCNTKQTASILSHLLPHLYSASPFSPPSASHSPLPNVILSLLHELLESYPSQSRYFERLYSLPRAFIPRDSEEYRWVNDLARCLRRRSYANLEELTCRHAFTSFFLKSDQSASETSKTQDATLIDAKDANFLAGAPAHLALEAACVLNDALRAKARETTWLVLRSAYRELHCLPSCGDNVELKPDTGTVPSTAHWLIHSLALHSVTSGLEHTESADKLVNEWMAERCTAGEVRPKDGAGMEGRWMICKVVAK
ncbi:hypothetical protein POSPLADRAFT_1048138 [Postia placenta MAD-698-R-SB12]|uniref:Ion transport domain-containing protein n=1 Tax=Postia placenta MAD-698-R-SB12 TaxID=670580 RepID=A0A1X6MTD8_9APHY|nr:hypothetical protein POSPLADRAFT_1048138 [Postia placenta MAD-698-R-SB12]OSX59638.1 hypothetical protein POSPLADRAFT_1048138 [Postia placenta MAD-698-R-SB12]